MKKQTNNKKPNPNPLQMHFYIIYNIYKKKRAQEEMLGLYFSF